ncbi:MAG: SAM-dependent methyltransferase [Acetobacteraceae bacterium]
MTSVPPSHFEALYATDPDPWSFETSAYEAGKYAATMAALDRPRFTEAAEIGCSIGVLTAMLAARCDALIGVDFAADALDRARARCASLAHVRFARLRVPGEWPRGAFDLIVLSELLYFLDEPDIHATAARVLSTLRPRGRVVLVNYLGETDGPMSGDHAASCFLGAASLKPIASRRAPLWRLDLLAAD